MSDPRVSFDLNPTPLPANLARVEPARIKYATENCATTIYSAEDLIRKALKEQPDTAVSWSGGKDSTVVLHMALQQKPDILVNFNNTGVEFPETYEFIEYITEEWDLNLLTLFPKKSFWATVDEYGFPQVRGKYGNRKRGKDGRPMCCQVLKEEPLRRAKLSSTLTGITAGESRVRTFTFTQFGQFYYAKTLKRHQWHPIGLWSHADVWAYHRDHSIPHNKIYDKGHHRCGCWPCTGFLEWKKYISKSHPRMYRALMKKKGEPTLWEFRGEYEDCLPDEVELHETSMG